MNYPTIEAAKRACLAALMPLAYVPSTPDQCAHELARMSDAQVDRDLVRWERSTDPVHQSVLRAHGFRAA